MFVVHLLILIGALIWSCGSAQAQQSFTAPECDSAQLPDQDADGLSDSCEVELARAVAPILMVRSGRCNWDSSATPGRLGGGYLFGVQQVDSVLRVAYLPAYFRDCGWSGAKCWIPWVSCAPHNGDSEFILVDLERNRGGSEWIAQRIFLSAHCFGRSRRSCRWYERDELGQFAWSGAAPQVWVAEGRNANYPSKEECDKGHQSLDTCDSHDTEYRFPVDARRNIGSRTAPFHRDGCVSGAELSESGADPDAVECIWRQDTTFRGWQREGSGVTGYSRYLTDIAQF